MNDREKNLEGLVRKQVLELNEYKPGATSDAQSAVKLSANENNFGTCKAVVEALRRELTEPTRLNRYPDITCTELRNALSDAHSLPSDWFLVGNGLDDVITLLATTFIEHGDEIVVPTATFGVYESVCCVMGATARRVRMRKDLSIDVDGIADILTDKTKMIWICNPNNPTGTVTTKEEFEHLLDATKRFSPAPLLIVDQAYIDFASDTDANLDAMRYLSDNPNLVVLRTMSKISGLAALRLGYAIAHPALLSFIYRIRPPYTVNALAQAAAVVDIRDAEALAFRKRVRESIDASRNELESYFRDNEIPFVPSQANFVFAFYDRPYEWLLRLSERLAQKEIFVRTLKHRDAPAGIRFSIGTPDENKALIKALSKILPDFT
ncbi:histidinol-phosphate transaminase [Synergistaceae bacterium OttesenSCG-928-I11]|nr:histidinol-phosphate transaminase [Synergistaceae bacterium OttesenSCG-928-I11]